MKMLATILEHLINLGLGSYYVILSLTHFEKLCESKISCSSKISGRISALKSNINPFLAYPILYWPIRHKCFPELHQLTLHFRVFFVIFGSSQSLYMIDLSLIYLDYLHLFGHLSPFLLSEVIEYISMLFIYLLLEYLLNPLLLSLLTLPLYYSWPLNHHLIHCLYTVPIIRILCYQRIYTFVISIISLHSLLGSSAGARALLRSLKVFVLESEGRMQHFKAVIIMKSPNNIIA